MIRVACLRRGGAAWLLAAYLGVVGPAVAQPVDEFAQLIAGAEAGQAEAQFWLAEAYRLGLGVPQNYLEAARWYEAAVDQGSAPAMNGLAGLYAEGLGVAPDPDRAFALISAAAEAGAPEFLHNLATAHEFGIGTEADPARAAEFYAQAMDKGWVASGVSLGMLYQEGIGLPKDVDRARELYLAAAQAGDARAQNNLGVIYLRGGDGIEQDYALALQWISQAAEQGMSEALRNLATMYQNGFGVAPDEAMAERLNRLAALRPGELADAAGVRMMFDPRLAPPDPARAAEHVVAARAGDPVALFLLGYLQAEAASTAQEYRAAARLFEAAAARGSSAAMANLGLMMFAGRGTLQDYVEGYKWLSLAAAAGLPGAIGMRDLLAKRMTPAQINTANDAAAAAWTDGTISRVAGIPDVPTR